MNAVSASIYTTLTGGTALTGLLAAGTAGVYQVQAPDGAALPYVVYSKHTGGPENVDPHDRRDLLYFVRAYAANAKAAELIDAQCDALLHRKAITVTGKRTVWCVRDQDIELVENPTNGIPIYAEGGLYRIRVT